MNYIHVLAGIRTVNDLGPRGGERRRYQVWIERREDSCWAPDGSGTEHHYGEIYSRRWLAGQAAIHAAEHCRAAEAVGKFLQAGSVQDGLCPICGEWVASNGQCACAPPDSDDRDYTGTFR